jgi:hypothetical protein
MTLDEAVATFKRELPELVVVGERMLGVPPPDCGPDWVGNYRKSSSVAGASR